MSQADPLRGATGPSEGAGAGAPGAIAGDARLALVHEWLTREAGLEVERIEPASSDASFRRYFRVFHARGTLIVMDAPPEREDVRPYLTVSALLESLGVHVPHVHGSDSARGLVLLEDLGSVHYLSRLEAGGDPEVLYGDALDTLANIQARGARAASALPPYDRDALLREMALMPEWFCGRHLGLALTREERELLEDAFEWLIGEALAQPQVLVHRDYHSRNLMVVERGNPGVIDFQDALRGPVGYDIVSLLKDCYICWPRARVVDWVSAHRARLTARGFDACASDAELLRWVDLIGVQRHLKVLGIFARLWYRDGKPGYLRDLPLTLRYVLEACAQYPRLAALGGFLERRAASELPRANARARVGGVPPRAMVLAAGRGERMRPLTDHAPKPLLQAGGKPLIGHLLEGLARAGLHEVVINLWWLGGAIRQALGDGSAYGLRIAYSEDGPVPLETAGGILHALPLLGGEPFLVVNGDIWTDFDFRALTLDGDALARIVLVPNAPHHPRGDFGLDGDRVVERERDRYTYSGIGLYRPEFFADCAPGRFPLLPLLERAIAGGRLRGQVYRGTWLDIGTPARLAELDARLRARGGVVSAP